MYIILICIFNCTFLYHAFWKRFSHGPEVFNHSSKEFIWKKKQNKNTGVSFFLCHFFSFSIIWIISVPTFCVSYGLYLYRGLLRLYCEKWSSDIWRMNGAGAISFHFRMSGYAMVGNFVLCYFSLLYLFIFMLLFFVFFFIIFVAFFIVVISLGVWIGDTKNEFNHCTVIDCKTVVYQTTSLIRFWSRNDVILLWWRHEWRSLKRMTNFTWILLNSAPILFKNFLL